MSKKRVRIYISIIFNLSISYDIKINWMPYFSSFLFLPFLFVSLFIYILDYIEYVFGFKFVLKFEVNFVYISYCWVIN